MRLSLMKVLLNLRCQRKFNHTEGTPSCQGLSGYMNNADVYVSVARLNFLRAIAGDLDMVRYFINFM